MDGPADRLDAAFPIAARVAMDLIRRPEVANRWSSHSALAKMTVGALACHLGRQVVHAAELLPTVPINMPRLTSVDDHYGRAAWVRTNSPDHPVNDRSDDDAEAELGHSALVDRVGKALAEVRLLLGASGASDVIPIPWQGWSLRRGDFLLTRMIEIVVHADDLAASLGVPAPPWPDMVFDPVRDLLVRLAVHRHGQSAVITALARRERAGNITAF